MGHALHPLLTDVVIGSWVSASMLDLVGGEDAEQAAERLIARRHRRLPADRADGLVDWADGEPVGDDVRRVGLVHAGRTPSGSASTSPR